jgi:hypothetical protein
MEESTMEIATTDWFDAATSTPKRHGWYEVQLGNGDTAFAKFDEQGWTEKPVLTFEHWRGLVSDPAQGGETESVAAEASVATGVRAVWDAFFPALAEPDAAVAGSTPAAK